MQGSPDQFIAYNVELIILWTMSYISSHEIILIPWLLDKSSNEVINCCIININKCFVKLHWPCMITIFAKLQVRMLALASKSMVSKKRIYKLYLDTIKQNWHGRFQILDKKSCDERIKKLGSGTHYSDIFPPLTIMKMPKCKPII